MSDLNDVMSTLLDLLAGTPITTFPKGKTIIHQNEPLTQLFVLVEGEVEVLKDGVSVSRISNKGSSFGEISALLTISPTATVVTTKETKMHVVENSHSFLSRNSHALLIVSKLLARRVRWLTRKYVQETDDGDSALWLSR